MGGMKASHLGRAVAAGHLLWARPSEPRDLEPAARSALRDPVAGPILIAAIGFVCTCTRPDFDLTPKAAAGVDILLYCRRCERWGRLEVKGPDAAYNCCGTDCGHRAHPHGHCQLGGRAEPGTAFVLDFRDRPPAGYARDLCDHGGWGLADSSAVVESLVEGGLRAGPGGGDVAIGVARVMAAAKNAPWLVDGVSGLPGCLDRDTGPTPQDVLQHQVRRVFRDARILERVANNLRWEGFECEALDRQYALRLRVDDLRATTYFGCYDDADLGPLGTLLAYTVGDTRTSSVVWELCDGTRASVDTLGSSILCAATWQMVQGVVSNPNGFATQLVLDRLAAA
jgi:hypothetical protein